MKRGGVGDIITVQTFRPEFRGKTFPVSRFPEEIDILHLDFEAKGGATIINDFFLSPSVNVVF